jgi:hypothetical protein
MIITGTKISELSEELISCPIIYKILNFAEMAKHYSGMAVILKYKRNFILKIASNANK